MLGKVEQAVKSLLTMPAQHTRGRYITGKDLRSIDTHPFDSHSHTDVRIDIVSVVPPEKLNTPEAANA
jgi:hypothetical protein